MTEALRLLLVTANDDLAQSILQVLEPVGYPLCRQPGVAEAVAALRQKTFDLILIDHDLPGSVMVQALETEGFALPVLTVTPGGLAESKDPAFLAQLPRQVEEAVAHQRLQQFNRLLIEAMESAGDGILITERSGTILHVNGALERMTGYSRPELLGQNPRMLKSGLHPPEVYRSLWQAVLSGTTWQGELTDRRKDGTLYDVWQTIAPIMNRQGQVTHFISIQRDLTERKQLEQRLAQAQKLQSIGTLAGGIAHEFNNLLAGILGYASLALDDMPSDAANREYLQNVLKLSERAAQLTGQLLAFARKPLLLRRPVPMADLVRSTAELVNSSMRRDVQLELEPCSVGAEPLLVEADASHLQQAIVNLAMNAHESLGEQAAPIVFRLRRETLATVRPGFPDAVPPGTYAVVEVADTGTGMTPAVLTQALDPFYTTKDVGQGTGLGLPVAFGLVHAHQGFLHIETEVNRGTRVTLFLPCGARKPAASVDLPIR